MNIVETGLEPNRSRKFDTTCSWRRSFNRISLRGAPDRASAFRSAHPRMDM